MSISEYELAGVSTSSGQNVVDAVRQLGHDSVSDWIKHLQDENNRKTYGDSRQKRDSDDGR